MKLATLEPVAGSPESRNIALLVESNPVIVLTDRAKRDDLFAEIRREVASHVPDLTTEKGRKAIASLAFKVTRTKTAIDEAGKKLNEDARARISAVDAERREIKARLDELRDQARRPLDEWEAAEEARIERVKGTLETLKSAGAISLSDTVESLKARREQSASIVIDDGFQEYSAAAAAHKAAALEALDVGIARLEREAADRLELERLRAEAAEREAKAEAERIEAARKAKAEAEAKAQVEAAEKAAAEAKAAIEAASLEAERRARADAEAKASAEAAAKQLAHDQALAAEKRRADAAVAARKAEEARQAKIAAEQAAEAKREADAQAAREADRAHRAKVMGDAKAAIIGHGVGEATAKAIILAIVAGEVPNVSLRF
jgi:hypothetical protein